MFCEKCGKEIGNYDYYCSNCGKSFSARDNQSQFRQVPDIPSYLAQSILTTLLCCLPFGIVAIVYASNVQSKIAIGDFQAAKENSDKAKFWCWVSFWCWLAPFVLYIGFIIFIAAIGAVSC